MILKINRSVTVVNEYTNPIQPDHPATLAGHLGKIVLSTPVEPTPPFNGVDGSDQASSSPMCF